MKLEPANVKNVTRGVNSRIQYTIINNPKMFQLLSNGLYKDKIMAPIRELGTNAKDAHDEAGTVEVASDVHVPSTFEPYYAIRDYGTGMALDTMKQLYSVYGRSNRTESNNYVGCMGLGSKAPFAYTNSFTTTSYYNGMKHILVSSIGPDGIPTIDHILSEETDEPNGCEIKFAVKSKDIYTFRNKLQQFYAYATVLPNFSNDLEVTKVEELTSGHNWFKLKTHNQIRSHQSYIHMGEVAYPIDCNHFSDGEHEVTYLILGCGIHIKAEIGGVEMDMSREGLQYTAKTIQYIIDHAEQMVKEYENKLSKTLDKYDNMWSVRCAFSDMITGDLLSRTCWKILKRKTIIWKNQVVSLTNRVPATVHSNDLTMVLFRRGERKGIQTKQCSSLTPQRGVIIYENDLKTGSHVRSKQILATGKYNVVYLVKFNTLTARQYFYNVVGVKNLPLISEIPYISKSRGTATVKQRRYLYITNRYHYNSRKSIDKPQEGGFYVPLTSKKDGERIRWNGHLIPIPILQKAVEAYGALTKEDLTIYLVPPSYVKPFNRYDIWVDFLDYLLEHLPTLKNDDQYHLAQNNIYVRHNIPTSIKTNQQLRNDLGANTNSSFVKFLRKVDYASKNGRGSYDYQITHLLEACQIPIPDPTLKADYFSIQQQYPLLYFDLHPSSTAIKAGVSANSVIAQYVNLVDRSMS